MNELIKIASSIKLEADGFEVKLRKIINNSDNFLKDYLVDFMFSKPKRLRPIFTYLFSKMLNISDKNVDNIALSLELIHNASLIHDDILDEEPFRRTIPTFCNKFGSKIAVLEGDFLLSSALETLSECPNGVIKIFAKKIKDTILGELNQSSKLNQIRSVDEYINKTLNKTTSLFLAGIECLFCLKETDETIKNSILGFMKNYSVAFQIKNDITNIKNNSSSDIKCGNYTLPVIYFCLDKNIDKFDFDIFDKEKEKYINKTIQKIEEYKNSAINYLDKTDNSIYKKEVIELCEYTLRS